VPNNRLPILSNVADRMVGADSRFPIQAASGHRSVDLCPRCCPDVPRTSIAPSATPLLLSGYSIHRFRSASGCAILPTQSGHASRIAVEATPNRRAPAQASP
jgi:hypothetical protein